MKIAYQPKHINDSFESLDLMHEHGEAITAICMGEDGMWSRVLAAKLGAFASYCSASPELATAPGQITLRDMIERFRWGSIDSATQVFGVVGDPVAQSMGPALFNRWFSEAKLNAVYLPLRVQGSCDSLGRFLDACLARPWLDVGGLSVTLPHKRFALDWIGSKADRLARSIGALNTLVFRGGDRRGYNTDCHAAIDSIVDALGCARRDLTGLPIDVLGSGGAARAIVAGLRASGSKITIFGRSYKKTAELAQEFDVLCDPWEERTKRCGHVLVNCTNVGMLPEVDSSPMPPDCFDNCSLVFDMIYNPLETKLLKEAAAAHVTTLGGLDMFIRQAAMQFELWTGKMPNQQIARELITREIQTQ